LACPSSKIKTALMDDSNRPPDAVLIIYEEFAVITQRLKDRLLKGTIVPTSEKEIPEFMYIEASL